MKNKYIILLPLIVLLVTGCGKVEKMTCTLYTDEDSPYTATIDVEYQNNIITNATSKMEFKDEATANNMCAIFNAAEDAKNNLECNGTTIIMKNYHKSVSKEEIKKEDFVKYLEDQNYECIESK